MTLLDRTAILGAADLKTEDVPVPEWGGTVRVTVMTGTQRDAFAASMATPPAGTTKPPFVAALLAACTVDDAGQLVFTAEDVQALAAKSAVALERVADVATRLNGMAAAAAETATGN